MFRLFATPALIGIAATAQALTPNGAFTNAAAERHINESGYICSEVVSMSHIAEDSLWNVRCIEFHDGTGRAHFAVYDTSWLVEKIF